MDKIDEVLMRANYFAFTKIIEPDMFACGFASKNREDSLLIGNYFKRIAKGFSLSIKMAETNDEKFTMTFTRSDSIELLVIGNVWVPPAFLAVLEVYNDSSDALNMMRLVPVAREEGLLNCLSLDDSDEYKGSIEVTSCQVLV